MKKITDKGLAHLPKSLEKVILYECNNITIAGIETLIENCPSLKELTCSPELNHEE